LGLSRDIDPGKIIGANASIMIRKPGLASGQGGNKMNGDNKGHTKKQQEKSGSRGTTGTTKISAKIEKIDKNAEAEFSRIHEKDVDPQENTDSERNFELKLNIKELKGSVSLADVIKKKSKGGPKKWKIL
jgi:hypothetical protein